MANNDSILTVVQVSQLLHRDPQTVRYILDNKLVPWGMSYRRKGSKRKSYLIYKDKFEKETGIKVESGGRHERETTGAASQKFSALERTFAAGSS